MFVDFGVLLFTLVVQGVLRMDDDNIHVEEVAEDDEVIFVNGWSETAMRPNVKDNLIFQLQLALESERERSAWVRCEMEELRDLLRIRALSVTDRTTQTLSTASSFSEEQAEALEEVARRNYQASREWEAAYYNLAREHAELKVKLAKYHESIDLEIND